LVSPLGCLRVSLDYLSSYWQGIVLALLEVWGAVRGPQK
jgi:hypothetical protein